MKPQRTIVSNAALTMTLIIALPFTAHAATSLSVTDHRFNHGTSRNLNSTNGDISAPTSTSTMIYTLTNVDLTSVGGSSTETIVFDVDFTATGGSPAFNTYGNLAVNGDTATQIDNGETLTATLSLVSSTFGTSNLSIGFMEVFIGGVDPGTGTELWDIVHDGGTINASSPENTYTFSPSSTFTIQNIATGDTVNLQAYDIQITAVPEPAAFLLGCLGIFLLLRRKRCD